jgi:predicted transposase YdaD
VKGAAVPKASAHARRAYKNNLFVDYFSDKRRLIEAYNALSGKSFSPDAAVEFETLAGVLHGGLYNDIAFVLEGRYIVLMEHQSTINANMPLRLLLYIAHVYERMIPGDDLYRRDMRKIPTPEFLVVYNGRDPYPDQQVLRLSEAFMVAGDYAPALELVATVHNVAKGHSKEVLAKSVALSDYSSFVAMVERWRTSGLTLDEAITKAIRECKRRGIMAAYLESRGSEVLNMLLTEWNMEDALRVAREEERERGVRIGVQQGMQQGARDNARTNAKRMKDDGLDIRTIAKYTGLTPAEVIEL